MKTKKKTLVGGIIVLRNGSSSTEKADKTRGHMRVTHGKMSGLLLAQRGAFDDIIKHHKCCLHRATVAVGAPTLKYSA
jgi:hypothetical protein